MTAQTAPEYVLINARTGAELASRLDVVRSSWRRAISLVGRRWLDRGEGIRFLSGPGVFAHRLPVDMLFLDRNGMILHAVNSLTPFEVLRSQGVHSIVELPAGTLTAYETRVGDVVEMFRAAAMVDADGQPRDPEAHNTEARGQLPGSTPHDASPPEAQP